VKVIFTLEIKTNMFGGVPGEPSKHQIKGSNFAQWVRGVVQESGPTRAEIEPESYGWGFSAGGTAQFVRVSGGPLDSGDGNWFVSVGRQLTASALLPGNSQKVWKIFAEEERIFEVIRSAVEQNKDIEIVGEFESQFP
jgi:hypothetical protein